MLGPATALSFLKRPSPRAEMRAAGVTHSPVVDPDERRGPEEEGGHEGQDRDSQGAAGDDEHVQHVQVHAAPHGPALPVCTE